MEDLLVFIQSHVEFAPYLICGALLLAGFNVPVSEDAMIFVSAMLATKNPEMTISLFVGVFAGAYISDLIAFALGKYFGPKLFRIKFFANAVSPAMMDRLNEFYDKYGILTLLFGRFVPFGVRNGLFITAGIGQMNPWKFSLSDLLACIISVTFFFTLYFHYGASVIEYVKQGNIVVFSLALLLVAFLLFKRRVKTRKK